MNLLQYLSDKSGFRAEQILELCESLGLSESVVNVLSSARQGEIVSQTPDVNILRLLWALNLTSKDMAEFWKAPPFIEGSYFEAELGALLGCPSGQDVRAFTWKRVAEFKKAEEDLREAREYLQHAKGQFYDIAKAAGAEDFREVIDAVVVKLRDLRDLHEFAPTEGECLNIFMRSTTKKGFLLPQFVKELISALQRNLDGLTDEEESDDDE